MRAGLKPHDAHVFIKLVENVVAANFIHRFESKLDALNTKLTVLFWFGGVVIAILGILAALNLTG